MKKLTVKIYYGRWSTYQWMILPTIQVTKFDIEFIWLQWAVGYNRTGRFDNNDLPF